MALRKSSYRLISALALVGLVCAPAGVESQCPVTNTQPPAVAGSFVVITKTLSVAVNCVTTGQNAFGCGRAPSAAAATKLIASALTMVTAAPYCDWSCTCGIGPAPHVTIDSGDGLPVELMDFSIED